MTARNQIRFLRGYRHKVSWFNRLDVMEAAGINAELPGFTSASFREAIDTGYGVEEHAALIKILRTDGPCSAITIEIRTSGRSRVFNLRNEIPLQLR